MARTSSRAGDLFITIGGDVTPLRSAMKAGKSVLNEFGMAAIDIQKEVGDALSKMGANAPAQAKKLEQAFTATFNQIRRNAQAVLNAPANDQAMGILNAAGAREAAMAAEAQAAALRQVADAAIRADQAAGGTNAGVRLLAVSSETAAQEAAQHAAALKTQAAALETVQAELGTAAGATEVFNEAQSGVVKVSNAGRMAQMELLHSVRASVDQFAFGTPIMQIFSLQVAQVGQAAALAGESFGKVGKFLSGPWGIIMIAAGSVLATLISKHQNAARSAKDHADAEATLISYVNGEKIATDALAESIAKLNEQDSKSIQLKDEAIRKTIELTKAVLAQAQAQRTVLASELATAKQRLAAAKATEANSAGQLGVGASSGPATAAQAEVDQVQRALDDLDTVIGQTTARISTNIVKLARDLSTNVGRANDEFDRKQAALEAKYRGTETVSMDAKGNAITTLRGGLLNNPNLNDAQRQQLTQQLSAAEEKLNAARAKAVAAAQKLDDAENGVARSAEKADRQLGKQIDFAEAERIARGAGLSVTSGYRSVAKQAALYNDPNVNKPGNPVARPGSSAHNGANGKWALDIAFAPGLTPAKLKKLYGDQGVSLTAVYKESGHYHIEGSRSEAAAAENAAEKARQKETDQNDYFAQQMERLDGELIQARGELLGSVEQQARFASDQIESERKSYVLGVQKAVDDGKIRDAQGKELIERENVLAAQRQANIAVRTFIEKQDELQKTIDQDYDFRRQNLRYQQEIARSSKDRRDIALAIVDLEYQQKAADLQIARAKAVEAQKWDEVSRIDAQIAALPEQKAQNLALAARQNQSPMQDYFDKLPHNLAEVRDRLEEIQVTGLKQLNDDLSSAITKTLGLKGALGDVVDMLLKLAFDAALSALFPKRYGGARAKGGGVNPTQWYVVGENGPEIFVPSSSGTIVPNSVSSAASPRPMSLIAANNNAPQRQVVELHLKDEMLEARIASGAQVEIVRNYPAMKADTLHAANEQRRRSA